ncbi:phosphofurin acidic cluster sorting protein 1-like isoform X2 [Babylonia areolata]|uniref:phosphofurin acidic cluster sorting protein 1-like isoform X2 n=1 Tax=Babylonia areolata TaxID=304850 RepID=UPI003FD2DA83
MADKAARSVGSGDLPVRAMKLFATWEVEKSSPSCIPRLCTMTLTRLHVLKPLDNELTSMVVAVKMQNSKRILRSNEISVPPAGVFDTGLDLSFSLQYPHFLKRDGNKMLVMLQRRKKYKNRTILGFKTLAIGHVNMSQVLQRSVDNCLNLYSDAKERINPVAQLAVYGLSSQPVDHDDNGHRKQASSDVDRSPDVDNDSDEDEVQDYNEYSSNDEMSDSEPIMMDEHPRPRKSSRSKARPATSRQRNLKQKFRALIRKFKLTEDVLELDSEADHDPNDPDNNDEMLDELEDLSDSGPEVDTISVMSTPKPRLRPFFTGRSPTPEMDIPSRHDSSTPTSRMSCDSEAVVKRSESDWQTYLTSEVDSETAAAAAVASSSTTASSTNNSPSTARPKSPSHLKPKRFGHERSTSYREKKSKKEYRDLRRHRSFSAADDLPGKALLEQLNKILDVPDDRLPDSFFLINTADWTGQVLCQKVQDRFQLIKTCSEADVKAAVVFLVSKIQKFCNSNARSPAPIKVGIIGGDAYINSVLRPYVEHFSAKTPDWQTYIKFLLIPLGNSSIAKYLGGIDSTYSSLFMDSQWRDMFEKQDSPKLDSPELSNRLSLYLSSANSVQQVPVAEALIMCKGKGNDENSTQIFIPFISEVRIGTLETLNTSTSVEIEDSAVTSPSLSSSPPLSTPVLERTREPHTPPSSPNIGGPSPATGSQPSTSGGPSTSAMLSNSSGEYMDLQVDYWWTMPKSESSDKDKKDKRDASSKFSLKTAFRSLVVSRMAPSIGAMPSSGMSVTSLVPPAFSMTVVTKEKKQKIMRIGKKAKDLESKSQVIDSISRMVCTTKSQNMTLTVVVDGVEWHNVKFFQLSSQWQTHIKNFPVAIFTSIDAF